MTILFGPSTSGSLPLIDAFHADVRAVPQSRDSGHSRREETYSFNRTGVPQNVQRNQRKSRIWTDRGMIYPRPLT